MFQKQRFFCEVCSIFVPALYAIEHNGNSVTQFSLNASRTTRAATAEQSEVCRSFRLRERAKSGQNDLFTVLA